MKRTIQILAIVAILLLGACSIGIAYAFTGWTENSNNNSVAEYGVLRQDSYTFSANAEMDAFTIVVRDNGNPKLMYCFAGSDQLATISGVSYYGKLIGQSSITADYSLGEPLNPKQMCVDISNSGTVQNLSNSDWRYVLQFTANNKATQYAVTDGSGTWSYYIYSGGSYVAETHLEFTESVTYTSKLYLAGPAFDVPDDGVNNRYVAAAQIYLNNPPTKQNDLSSYNSGHLLVGATITYTYDSTWTNS